MNRKILIRVLSVFFAGGAAFIADSVMSHSYRLGDISIGHIYSPPPGEEAVGIPVYGVIFNRGGKKARLVGATSPAADNVRFRIENDGETRWLDSIEFSPGKPLALASWRQHIWIAGLKRRLRKGDSFDLTLKFAEAGRITVKVLVENQAVH